MSFFKAKEKFFSHTEEKAVVAAIKEAELQTSGEIRVHVEFLELEHLQERAMFIFDALGMNKTKDKNGILIYLNPQIKNFLIIGDEGIHAKVGQSFWENLSAALTATFKSKQYALGTIDTITQIGKELKAYFPYNKQNDTNELNDEISYEV